MADASWLQTTANILEIASTGDRISLAYLDRFRVEHPRALKPGDPPGRWLIEHEASEALLRQFPLESCKGDKVKMRLHILALAKLARWDEVSDVARFADTGLEPHIATVMAVAAARSRPNAKAEADAKAVLADRQLTVPDLAAAAQLAEEHGLNEAAIYLLEFLLEDIATMPEAANKPSRGSPRCPRRTRSRTIASTSPMRSPAGSSTICAKPSATPCSPTKAV